METNSCLELASGHDILTPECEPYVVQQYLQTLRSHRIIHQSRCKLKHDKTVIRSKNRLKQIPLCVDAI